MLLHLFVTTSNNEVMTENRMIKCLEHQWLWGAGGLLICSLTARYLIAGMAKMFRLLRILLLA